MRTSDISSLVFPKFPIRTHALHVCVFKHFTTLELVYGTLQTCLRICKRKIFLQIINLSARNALQFKLKMRLHILSKRLLRFGLPTRMSHRQTGENNFVDMILMSVVTLTLALTHVYDLR